MMVMHQVFDFGFDLSGTLAKCINQWGHQIHTISDAGAEAKKGWVRMHQMEAARQHCLQQIRETNPACQFVCLGRQNVPARIHVLMEVCLGVSTWCLLGAY